MSSKVSLMKKMNRNYPILIKKIIRSVNKKMIMMMMRKINHRTIHTLTLPSVTIFKANTKVY